MEDNEIKPGLHHWLQDERFGNYTFLENVKNKTLPNISHYEIIKKCIKKLKNEQ